MVAWLSLVLSIPLLVSGAISYCNSGSDWTGTCSTGTNQSPINIDTTKLNTTNINKGIICSYADIKTQGEFTDHNYELEGNFLNGTLNVGSEKVGYSFQFHFHSPSEHTIDGIHYDLEMHSVQKDSSGTLLYVIGVLFKAGGSSNDFLEKVIESEEKEISINIEDAFDGKMNIMNFFYYKGSLTTPPCAEGIEWFVWAEVQDMSDDQLKFFTSAWSGNSTFGCGKGNNRLTQALNDRTVVYYESGNLLILGLSILVLIF